MRDVGLTWGMILQTNEMLGYLGNRLGYSWVVEFMPIMQKSWVEFPMEKEREEERNRKHSKITLRNSQPSLNGKNRVL